MKIYSNGVAVKCMASQKKVFYLPFLTIQFTCYFCGLLISYLINAKYMKPVNRSFISYSFYLLTSTVLGLTGCQSGNIKTEQPIKDTLAMQKDSVNVFEHLLVDNKKDPSCGMPVKAGISDTAHYKDKVLGFCSKECKDAFLKNPAANLAAAEIKN